METDFRNAKVGDKVWRHASGWGEITSVTHDEDYLLWVEFEGDCGSFTIDGRYCEDDISPTLFWDEIKFDIPERPKRKVKKVIEGWVNIYGYDNIGCLRETKEKAEGIAVNSRLGEPHHIIHEYEEDE